MLTGQATVRSCNGNSSRTHTHASESKLQYLPVASSRDDHHRVSAYVWFVVLGLLLCVLISQAAEAQPAAKKVVIQHKRGNLLLYRIRRKPAVRRGSLSGEPGRDSPSWLRWGKTGPGGCSYLSSASICAAIP